jgi:hypothetical protein
MCHTDTVRLQRWLHNNQPKHNTPRHQGFKYTHDGRVLMLWSAPNYCDRHQNLAAVLCASEHAAGPHSMYNQFNQSLVRQAQPL